MDTFENDLRAALRHAAAAGPGALALDSVYARAHRMHREQQARVTLASVGAASALGWATLHATGHSLGFDRITPVDSPTATVSPTPTGTPDSPTPTADPGDPAGPGGPSAEPTGEPVPEEPTPTAIPSRGPDDPFDPVDPATVNGPAAPSFVTVSYQKRDDGSTDVVASAVDPDGWIRQITFEWSDPDVDGDLGGQQTYTVGCSSDGLEPAGQDRVMSHLIHFVQPGDHDVQVTATSASCSEPLTERQSVEQTITVNVPGPAPLARKDLS